MNLVGALLLFYSFQATSSSFRLIKRPANSVVGSSPEYDMCVGDYTLLSTQGDDVTLGQHGCPTTADDRRAAVVNTEHPLFVTIGFLFLVGGFIVEFFAVPEPRTIAQLRQEIKLLKTRERANRPVDSN